MTGSSSRRRKRSGKPWGKRRWGGKVFAPGDRASVQVHVSESYLGVSIPVPLHVVRAKEPGPTLLVSAAVHGDEINGTGAIREFIQNGELDLLTGTLVLAPVVNVLGFERHSRYLPDRRDLNRCFPGTRRGSVASRLAYAFFDKVIRRCDYALDLHTAAVRRTNFPNVRGDLRDPGVRKLARAFGAEVILDSEGPEGALRREATAVGCPTLVVEAGEVWKVEPMVCAYMKRGVRNVLIELGMVAGEREAAPYRAVSTRTTWVRAAVGGYLRFHVNPGDLVEVDQPLATVGDLLGADFETMLAPEKGLILGMTTFPSVAPGDPIVHIAVPEPKHLRRMESGMTELDDESLGARVRSDLASSVLTSELPEDPRAMEDLDEN